MKLNIDCIYDILCAVEDTVDYSHAFQYESDNIPEILSTYSNDELVYHIMQCEKSGLVSGVRIYGNADTIVVRDLTPAGHEFLANARTHNVWKKIKSLGAASLPIAINLAKDFALAYFQKL